ncbi:hypothetical protein D3C85_223130 [compost metagenome]
MGEELVGDGEPRFADDDLARQREQLALFFFQALQQGRAKGVDGGAQLLGLRFGMVDGGARALLHDVDAFQRRMVQTVELIEQTVRMRRGLADGGDQIHLYLAPVAALVQPAQPVARILQLGQVELALVAQLHMHVFLKSQQTHADAGLFHRQGNQYICCRKHALTPENGLDI